jgi:hypothetical protein
MKQKIRRVAFLAIPLLVLGLCGANAARAGNYTFSIGNFSQSNIGNVQGAAGYDGLTLRGTTGSFSLTPGSSLTLPISNVFFNVGYTGGNSKGPANGPTTSKSRPHKGGTGGGNSKGPVNGTATFAVTVDGVMQVFNLPFTVDIGMHADTLTIGSKSLNFDLGNSGTVSLSSVQFGPLSSGGPTSGTLEGMFSTNLVSEPGSLALFGTGLLLLGCGLNLVRRKLSADDLAVEPLASVTDR